MSKRWFICRNENVSGPFSNEDLIALSEREDLSRSLVWWAGLSEWMPVQKQIHQFAQFVNSQVDHVERPVWHYKVGAKESDALSLKDLAVELRDIPNASKVVLVRSPESPTYQPIFKHLELMELLGINQRKNKRVPVRGSVNVFVDDQMFQAQALTISVGGVGFKALNGSFYEGQRIKVEVKSPDLSQPFHTNGRIVHSTTTGEYGVAFDRLNPEHQVLIGDYIRRVTHSGNLKKSA